MPSPPDLTLDEAVQWLDPPISREVLAVLVTALRIRPVGTRRRPQGRPAYTYPAAELQALHAAVARWLPPPAEELPRDLAAPQVRRPPPARRPGR